MESELTQMYRQNASVMRRELYLVLLLWIVGSIIAYVLAFILARFADPSLANIWPPFDRFSEYCNKQTCGNDPALVAWTFIIQGFLALSIIIVAAIFVMKAGMPKSVPVSPLRTLFIFLAMAGLVLYHTFSIKFDFESASRYASAVSHSPLGMMRLLALGSMTTLVSATLLAIRDRPSR